MLKLILQIKLKSFFRQLSELGIFRIAVLFILVLMALDALLKLTSPVFQFSSLLLLLPPYILLAFINQKRKDKILIHQLISHTWHLYVLEYMLLGIPFSVVFFYRNALLGIIWLAVISTIPLLSFKVARRRFILPIGKWLKITDLELIYTLRVSWIYILMLLILAIALYFIPIVIPICTLFIALSLTGSAVVHEPLEVLHAYGRGAASFLYYKIKLFLLCWAVLSLPLLLLSFVIYPAYYYAYLYSLYIGPAVIIFSLLFKYSGYDYSTTVNPVQILLLSVLLIVVILNPIFVPLAVYLFFVFRKKALANLSCYLYAEN